MKIKKSSDGKTSVKITNDSRIIYDPGIDSYIIVLGTGVLCATIPSDLLDELHNRAWEGDDDPHMDKPNVED